ncbi:MAG: hypothetical protein DI540_11270 [Sphingobium sp.]|nr:MAG: hypothetical protein DI540_11270 [Sphingobium sp.]
MTISGRFQTILPCKGRWLAEGQTEGYPPLDSVKPLHHFVVPLPLKGRNLHPPLVASCRAAFLPRCGPTANGTVGHRSAQSTASGVGTRHGRSLKGTGGSKVRLNLLPNRPQ